MEIKFYALALLMEEKETKNKYMKKKYKILIIVLALVVAGILAWEIRERKYQACSDKCQAEFGSGLGAWVEGRGVCEASCREKYAK